MRRNIDMLNGSLYKGIISYTIPIILTSILQLLFNAADLVVVGRYCGSICVAAVSATGSLTNLITNLFIGLSVGAGATVAHGIGGQRHDDVHKTVHTAILTAIISGAILTVFGVIFSGEFLKLMKTPDNVLPLSAKYMRIYFGGMLFTMVYNFAASILRAAGDTKSPLLYLTIAGIINVILNLFFVIVLNMDVDGVALATIISQGISAVLVIIALTKRTDSCKLYLSKLRIYTEQFAKIIRIGLPAGLQSSLFSISNVIIQSSINSFNSDAIMSGNGSAANIEGFVYVTINSFSQAAVNFTGQNMGAHKFDRVKKVFGICLGYVTLFGLVTGITTRIFAPQLLSFYITDSPEAILYGIARMNCICLTYFLCGIMDTTTGALRGLGSSVAPMFCTVLGVCGLRIVWIYTIFQIPQYHTLDWLYISYPISWLITLIVEIIAYIILFKKKEQADKRLYALH